MENSEQKSGNAAEIFKECSFCGELWGSRECFLRDPGLTTIGYQVDFDHLETGLYLFNHKCGTTLAVHVREFMDMYKGPVYLESFNGLPECPGHCQDEGDMLPCKNKCKNSHFRNLLVEIKNWPKNKCEQDPKK